MPDLALPSDAFRLGSLTVVPSLNRLVREGATEDVEPRVMRVLAVLAETPGEVVSRAALFESVWADAGVNDEALTRAVSELRKALADGAPGAVETIRGTGYRLALPVVPFADPPERIDPSVEGADLASRLDGHVSTRRLPLAALALGVAAVALAVALWAAWPRGRPSPAAEGTDARVDTAQQAGGDAPVDAFHLDEGSSYYRPGLSELGVYYDSTADAYFRVAPDAE